IILGKVRPFLRRLAEAHPQVLIIAPSRGLECENETVFDSRSIQYSDFELVNGWPITRNWLCFVDGSNSLISDNIFRLTD
ncbi:hypothetical protein, partial [Mycobacterium sp. SMC-17]|uniref:hypothetical protein n=1 Tax=Mycobacterium sp. SMC-17 TaxID=3381628 RepID=UPI00387703A6